MTRRLFLPRLVCLARSHTRSQWVHDMLSIDIVSSAEKSVEFQKFSHDELRVSVFEVFALLSFAAGHDDDVCGANVKCQLPSDIWYDIEEEELRTLLHRELVREFNSEILLRSARVPLEILLNSYFKIPYPLPPLPLLTTSLSVDEILEN